MQIEMVAYPWSPSRESGLGLSAAIIVGPSLRSAVQCSSVDGFAMPQSVLVGATRWQRAM